MKIGVVVSNQHENFSFIPKPLPKTYGNYWDKAVTHWEWKDFQNYFTDEYSKVLHSRPPGLPYKNYGMRKKQIESSIEYWGRELLKDMIDVLLDIGPTLNVDHIDINLVCGQHYFANMIAEKAQKRKKFSLDFYEE